MDGDTHVTDRRSDPQDGERLIAGRYRILSQLREGPLGSLFEAEDLSTSEKVTIKVSTGRVPSKYVKDILDFGKRISELTHVCIVPVRDFGVCADGRSFVVRDWSTGQNLLEILTQRGPLSVDEVVRCFDQLCTAIQYAHQRHVIHGCLNPSNVFITGAAGSDLFAQLTDFGADVLTPGPAIAGDAVDGAETITGVPLYTSPEVLLGCEPDERSDIYSLGTLMYEAITGEPFLFAPGLLYLLLESNRADPFNWLYAYPPSLFAATELTRGLTLVASIDSRLDAVISTCLDLDPAFRYPSAEALRQDLNPSSSTSPPNAQALH